MEKLEVEPCAEKPGFKEEQEKLMITVRSLIEKGILDEGCDLEWEETFKKETPEASSYLTNVTKLETMVKPVSPKANQKLVETATKAMEKDTKESNVSSMVFTSV